MRKAIAFTFGAVLGGILGGLASLLLTPYSGKELRSTIRQQVDDIQVEIKEAGQNKRAELEAQLEVLIEQKEAK